MKYKNVIENDVLNLQLQGDLIGEDSGVEIIELVNNHIQEGIRKAVVDISGLRYINSSGIGVLITILTKFRNKGGELCLLKPSESVKKLLIITKLNAIFTIVDTKEEALDALES